MSVMKTLPPLPKTLLPLLKTLLPLLLLAALADGVAVFYGTCPQGQAVENFSPKAVIGKIWYEFSSYFDPKYDNYKCSAFLFSFSEGGRLQISKQQTLAPNDTKSERLWLTDLDEGQTNGTFQVISVNNKTLHTPSDFEVLHASSDFLILRSCISLATMPNGTEITAQDLYVLTTSKTPKTKLQKRISAKVQSLKPDMSKMKETNQTSCTYDFDGLVKRKSN